VSGRWRTRSYDDSDGNKRTAVELHADDIGPSLRFAVTPQTVRERERVAQKTGPVPFDDRQAGREPAGRSPVI
jgi:single-strand DNA-binding protein